VKLMTTMLQVIEECKSWDWLVVLLFVCVCGCNVLLKMELEETDDNKIQTFLLTKHLFYNDNFFFLYIRFMLATMFVLQYFSNNCVGGMPKFYVVLIMSISHL
jgi:hypothetical protein